jgi:hypothetical protein
MKSNKNINFREPLVAPNSKTGQSKNGYPQNFWDRTLAEKWHGFTPPSRPSESEIARYRTYFEDVRNKKMGPNPTVLILGTTNEFRKLAVATGFKTTIVDYSKDYHEEISTELDSNFPYKNETLVNCSWEEMGNNLELKGKRFDIIIGDLSVGNISPENLDLVLKNVHELLNEGGLFLGKTFLSFRGRKITKINIQELIERYSNKKIESREKAYAFTTYDLAVYSCDLNGSKKINFSEMSKTVKGILAERQETLGKEYLEEIYFGEDVFFNKQLINFYVYPCKDYSEKLQKYFDIIDTVFADDVYSKDFPLIICQNNSSKPGQTDADIEQIRQNSFNRIENYVKDDKRKYKGWVEALSAQQFLFGLLEIFPGAASMTPWQEIEDLVKKKVLQSLEVQIDNDLMFFLEKYTDTDLEKEAREKAISDENFEIDIMRNNYALGVLCYVITHLTAPLINDAFGVVKKKLFNNIKENEHGWEPESSPWVTARICLSLRKTWNLLKENEKKKMHSVIKYIGDQFEDQKNIWLCEGAGTVLDTTSLCIETLIEYYDVVDDEQRRIKSILDSILRYYVLDGQINETIVALPLSKDAASKITRKEEARITIDHVEFYTILLRALNFLYPNKYEAEREKLIRIISNFWGYFEGFINDRIQTKEISIIPQIVYCCAKAMEK